MGHSGWCYWCSIGLITLSFTHARTSSASASSETNVSSPHFSRGGRASLAAADSSASVTGNRSRSPARAAALHEVSFDQTERTKPVAQRETLLPCLTCHGCFSRES